MMTCYGDDSFQDDEFVGVVAGVRKYMALLLCFCGLESGISCGFGYILQSCCCNKNYYAFEPSNISSFNFLLFLGEGNHRNLKEQNCSFTNHYPIIPNFTSDWLQIHSTLFARKETWDTSYSRSK